MLSIYLLVMPIAAAASILVWLGELKADADERTPLVGLLSWAVFWPVFLAACFVVLTVEAIDGVSAWLRRSS